MGNLVAYPSAKARLGVRRLRRLLPMLALAASACDDGETGTTGLGTSGPASIAFVSPSGDAAPECRAIGTDVGARVPLLVAVESVSLRPPLACSAGSSCGTVRLYVDGVLNNESASVAIDLLVGKLASPYHDGEVHPSTGAPDVLDLRVELTDPEGQPFVGDDGAVLADEVALLVMQACP